MHPSRDELSGFLQGTLSEQVADSIAEHLDQCPDCDATLRDLDFELDTMVAAIRHGLANPDAFAQESGCQRMLERIQVIGRDPSFTSPPIGSLPDAPVLQRIGPYQLVAKLGEGGMGAVYKALHTRLKKVVALKILPAGRTPDQHALERFEREMEAVGRVEHPNIVRAMDADEHEGTQYLVMEYVDGLDLSAVVRAVGPLRIADACEAIRQAAVGLQHAHERRLVHRDIKPGNLMLSIQGQVKILDLGLARLGGALSPDRRELTSTGQVMGTLDYMAPEQGGDSRDVDIRADVYSLGASMYRLLTGEPPFYGPSYDTPIQKLNALAIGLIPEITTRRPEVSDSLAAVVHQMLAKTPADRFPTPGEVAIALSPFVDGADLAKLARRAADVHEAEQRDPQALSVTSTHDHLSAYNSDTTRNRAAARIISNVQKRSSNTPPFSPWIAVAAGFAFILLAATIWLVVRDKNGKETTRIPLKSGERVEIEDHASDGDDAVPKKRAQPAAVGTIRPDDATQPAEEVPRPVMDLLPSIDPNRDAVKGAWTRNADGLKSDGSIPFCRLVLPYEPPTEYDFHIEFTAKGGNDVLLLLAAGNRSFSFLMGGWGGRFDGFDAVVGHAFVRDGQNIIGGPSSIKPGQRHTAVIHVRKNLVRATIDAKQVVEHRTDGTDLSMPVEWTISTDRLGLGTTFDETIFHRIEVVEVSGEGKLLE